MANARRRAHRSKKYKTRKFRDAIEGAANNAVRPTPRWGVDFYRPRWGVDNHQANFEDEAKYEAQHEADRLGARLRLTRLLRGLAPHNLSWALTHGNELIRETALTGLATRTKETK